MTRAATKLEPNELVRCEGCRERPLVLRSIAGWCRAECRCGHTTWPTPCRSGAEAIAAWNRRATPEQPR